MWAFGRSLPSQTPQAVVQEEILKEAKEYTIHKMDDTEILTELQHYGGKTNLIDFTTDYLVALFFACDGEYEEPGRVILLQRPPKIDPKTYTVKEPPRTIRRAEVQKSIFVEAPVGVVDPDAVAHIPADLKVHMLDYLDMPGFFRHSTFAYPCEFSRTLQFRTRKG